MNFLYPELLLFIIFIIILFFFAKNENLNIKVFKPEILAILATKSEGFSKKTRSYLLLISLMCFIISLSRPYIQEDSIKIKNNILNVLVALDLSHSMKADDIYPNRFEFQKRKFFSLLDEFKHAQIGVLGFSSQAFLISPMSEDYDSLRFLVQNMDLSFYDLKGTNFKKLLSASEDILKNEKDKILIIFTDGGDGEFDEEIKYAKSKNLNIFVYNIGTQNANIMTYKGDFVSVKANKQIKNLADSTKGAYFQSSLHKDDIKALINDIQSKFHAKNSKEKEIIAKNELFIYPLILGIILYFLAIFSLKGRKK